MTFSSSRTNIFLLSSATIIIAISLCISIFSGDCFIMEKNNQEAKEPICARVPNLVSDFVDSFVNFMVGGQFLATPNRNSTPPGTRFSNPRSNSTTPTKHNPTSIDSDLEPTKHGAIPAKSDLTSTRIDNEDDSRWAENVTRLPPVERLVAIGDIHGDLQKARDALKVAKVMDEDDNWIGGKTVVVQVGDLLDRGGEELKVIYLLEKLKQQAERSGGRVMVLNGNHEIMNMEGDFRFVTEDGMEEFKKWARWYRIGDEMKDHCQGCGTHRDLFEGIPKGLPPGWRARLAALRPGGPISGRFLSNNPTVVVVGGSVFVHGGMLPWHVEHGLERMNEEVRDWIRGKGESKGPAYLHGRDAVVWLRRYSKRCKGEECNCFLLDQALGAIPGAKRMIVGHTIQTTGINGVCGNRVIRVDVGMSKGCMNGIPEVLEIRGDKDLIILTADPTYKEMKEEKKVKKEKPGLGIVLSEEPRQIEVVLMLSQIACFLKQGKYTVVNLSWA